MTRLPAAAFAALVLATVGAFFVTQHLKVKDPLINGSPRPDPPAINPISGRVCRDLAGKRVSFRRTQLNFFLQARSDNVAVYMVNAGDEIVSTVAANRFMRVNRRYTFTWNGRAGDGHGPVVPDGTYYFRIALQHEGRTFNLPNDPVRVITTPPHPVVSRVVRTGGRVSGGPPIIGSPGQTVTIHFTPGRYHNSDARILRTDLPGRPRVVKGFGINGRKGSAVWDGTVGGLPAPSGTYLVGLYVTDQACNPGTFPIVNPPPPGSTPHAGVTVRYLAAEPPLVPVPAGTDATVLVDSRLRSYSWSLRRSGTAKVLARGREGRGRYALRVRLPAGRAGLYTLGLRSGTHRTDVPLMTSGSGRYAAARVLVVLPALTWAGTDPVDDTGSGLPATLTRQEQIRVGRPFVRGLPVGFADQLALLGYLDRHRLPYQLTSDLALARGVGPRLAGHTGVLLDGSLVWLPSSLAPQLSAFARTGGSVLALGVDSLQAQARLSGSGGSLSAGPPHALSPDPFGARHGILHRTDGALITVLTDPLGLFRNTVAFPGFNSLQSITPPQGAPASLAGVGTGAAGIAGFRSGRGTVVEVGLPHFATTLAHNVDAQEFVSRSWKLLSR